MKRSTFLRLTLMAAVGLAVAPVLEFPQLPKLREKKFYIFKVSKDFLKNPLCDTFIEMHIKDFGIKGNIVEQSIGFMDDDFARNLYTIKLTVE